jgi:hypothetical protein
MKLVFKVKTEPVTQACIILAIVALLSGSLALIAIYSQSPTISVLCAFVLAIVIYTTPCLTPR